MTIRQDTKLVSVSDLISLYRTNPNRFAFNTEKSTFLVTGRIKKVGAASSLDEVTGFYVPLSSAPNEREFLDDMISEGRAETSTVSLFVKGLSKSDLAQFDPGDLIVAQCPKIRVVTDNLVFDECRLQRSTTK